MSWEDVVLIEESKSGSEEKVVTVNCPDKAGLGCDLLRIVLEFGLYVTRGGSFIKLLISFFVLFVMLFLIASFRLAGISIVNV